MSIEAKLYSNLFFILNALVISFYFLVTDCCARAYLYGDNFVNHKGNVVKMVLSDMDFKGIEKILDLGSGNGKITSILSSKIPGGKILGVDIDSNMVQYASKSHRRPNLSYKNISISELGNLEKVDIVTSFGFLNSIEDLNSVFEGVSQVLKKDGEFHFYIAIDKGQHRLDQAIEFISRNSKWEEGVNKLGSGFYLPKESDLKKHLYKNNLKIIKFKEIQDYNIFLSKKEFKKWLKSWIPHLSRIKNSVEKDVFLLEISDKYCEWHNNCVSAPQGYNVLHVIAKKVK